MNFQVSPNEYLNVQMLDQYVPDMKMFTKEDMSYFLPLSSQYYEVRNSCYIYTRVVKNKDELTRLNIV